jgi:hypothetical protein
MLGDRIYHTDDSNETIDVLFVYRIHLRAGLTTQEAKTQTVCLLPGPRRQADCLG